VQVRDPSHGQSGQVGDLDACGLGDGDRQGADGGRLVHHEQQRPVLGQGLDQGPELGFVLRQGLVEELLAGFFEGHRVVAGLADVDADEHVNGVVVVDHGAPHSLGRPGGAVSDETAGLSRWLHGSVSTLRPTVGWVVACPDPAPMSDVLGAFRSRWQHPRIMK
jgi:hypothetical protein